MKKIIILLILSVLPSWAMAQSEELNLQEALLFKELEGEQNFSKKDFHQKIDWRVEEKQAIQDSAPIKGQTHSTIDWEGQDPKEWLDIDRWLADRAIKDSTPDWKIRIRQNVHKELVGKILKCVGTCHGYRGTKAVKIRHLSQVREGDEIQTSADSYLWVFLMDGTMVRLSPQSSVSFNEINFSKKSIFFGLRLNQGHVYWHHRASEAIPYNAAPETDQVSLPLMVREANKDFFEREIYKSEDELQRFLSVTEGQDKAAVKLYEKMNELKKNHKTLGSFDHHVFLVTPNYSLDVKNQSFDAVYLPNEKGYFKRRDELMALEGEKKQFKFHYRGYAESNVDDITSFAWNGVSADGKSLSEESESTPHLSILELMTKRIPTIELAGEIWIEKYTLPLLKGMEDEAKFATDHGFRLWSDELNTQRMGFLHEYTRRIETTNLRSLSNLVSTLSSKGDWKQLIIDEKFYVKALESYVKSIKTQFNQKRQQRRLMNDLQFYAWILKNDK